MNILFNEGNKNTVSLDCVVKNVKQSFDHHLTNDPSNVHMLIKKGIYDKISLDPTITSITVNHTDTDSIASLILMTHPEYHNTQIEEVLLSASLWCDMLADNITNQKDNGLILHLLIRNKIGKTFRKLEVERYQASPLQKKTVMYRVLQFANSIVSNLFKDLMLDPAKQLDCPYLLEALEAQAKKIKSKIYMRNNVYTVITEKDYIDPLAVYKGCNTPIVVMHPSDSKYVIGLNHRFETGIDLRELARDLNRNEYNVNPSNINTTWGGRTNVIGSPRRKTGSSLQLEEVITCISDRYGNYRPKV